MAITRSKIHHIGPAWTPLVGEQINELFEILFIDGSLEDASQITTGILLPVRGGTGIGLYVIGDLLYANSTTSLARLADMATGNALLSGGIGAAPSWGKVSLTAAISGILGLANGGTGVATVFTPGSVIFAGASGLYSQDNAKFFWDDTNGRLGIGLALPLAPLHLVAAKSDAIPQQRWSDGTVNFDCYIGAVENAQLGTLTNHDVQLFTNGIFRVNVTKAGHILLGAGAADNALVTVKGDGATGATSAFDVTNASAVDLFRVRNDGHVAVGTNTFPSLLTLSRLSDGALPATLTNGDLYLQIGGIGFGANGYAAMGFGYSTGVAGNYSPVYIGYQEIVDTGSTKGDLIFGTRDVTTATQPVERLRIQANGTSVFSSPVTVTSYAHSLAEIDKTYQIYAPVTGATITMSAGQSRAIINPLAGLAALTITLPPTPVDGQVTGFSFTQAITILTINAPGGATVVASPTAAVVDTNFRFLYQASSTSWFPAS